MYGRRMEALQRYQEKSSLLANLSDDDIHSDYLTIHQGRGVFLCVAMNLP